LAVERDCQRQQRDEDDSGSLRFTISSSQLPPRGGQPRIGYVIGAVTPAFEVGVPAPSLFSVCRSSKARA
jgi:hypothetical protein